MATGQVLFHRFFYSKSFVKHSFEVSAAQTSGEGAGREEGKRRGGREEESPGPCAKRLEDLASHTPNRLLSSSFQATVFLFEVVQFCYYWN